MLIIRVNFSDVYGALCNEQITLYANVIPSSPYQHFS